jgi:hypothetical protein
LCCSTHTHAQVKILGDGTQELTTTVRNRLSHALGVTATSFASTGAVAKGGAVRGCYLNYSCCGREDGAYAVVSSPSFFVLVLQP